MRSVSVTTVYLQVEASGSSMAPEGTMVDGEVEARIRFALIPELKAYQQQHV